MRHEMAVKRAYELGCHQGRRFALGDVDAVRVDPLAEWFGYGVDELPGYLIRAFEEGVESETCEG